MAKEGDVTPGGRWRDERWFFCTEMGHGMCVVTPGAQIPANGTAPLCLMSELLRTQEILREGKGLPGIVVWM